MIFSKPLKIAANYLFDLVVHYLHVPYVYRESSNRLAIESRFSPFLYPQEAYGHFEWSTYNVRMMWIWANISSCQVLLFALDNTIVSRTLPGRQGIVT